MPSDKQYLEYIMDQLSHDCDVSYRPMMGEYVVYCQGKVVGGIYDDRFLVKQTESSKRLLPDAPLEPPYEGAKEMLLVENTDDRDLLSSLLNAIAEELPEPRKKGVKK